MRFEGRTEINAPRDLVWAFVSDPQQVGWCGPGVEAIEEVDSGRFRARIKVKVGPINARFVVHLEFLEQHAPERAVIRATGQAPGSAVDATGEMRLVGPDEGPTGMDWSTSVQISGAIASVGARLIEGTAKRLVDQAFDCMRGKLEEPQRP